MTKIYVYERIQGKPIIPELYPVYGTEDYYTRSQVHLADIFKKYTPFFEVVANPSDADYLLYPHWYKEVRKDDRAHLEAAVAFARSVDRILILIAYGDDDSDIALSNTIVLRYSQYRHRKRQNEIIIPPYAPEKLEGEITLRHKHDGVPSISFCGRARHATLRARLKEWIKNSFWEGKAIILRAPYLRAHKGGVSFRERMLQILAASPDVETHFIVRTFFSLNRKTAIGSIESLQKEFLDNLVGADFALTVRGDGNAATRFYEALSVGRMPVVVDTDSLLPLEDIIDYQSFCLFVPYTDMASLGKHIRAYYDSMDDEEYVKKQRRGREVFETYLRADAFYRFLFSHPREISSRATPL